jgi:hypothetical protein
MAEPVSLHSRRSAPAPPPPVPVVDSGQTWRRYPQYLVTPPIPEPARRYRLSTPSLLLNVILLGGLIVSVIVGFTTASHGHDLSNRLDQATTALHSTRATLASTETALSNAQAQIVADKADLAAAQEQLKAANGDLATSQQHVKDCSNAATLASQVNVVDSAIIANASQAITAVENSDLLTIETLTVQLHDETTQIEFIVPSLRADLAACTGALI